MNYGETVKSFYSVSLSFSVMVHVHHKCSHESILSRQLPIPLHQNHCVDELKQFSFDGMSDAFKGIITVEYDSLGSRMSVI